MIAKRAALIGLVLGVLGVLLAAPVEAGPSRSSVNPSTTTQVLTIAHRGSHRKYGENSVAATKDAYRRGASCVDADARKTSDGKWIAYHDRRLDWKTDGTGAVKDQTWAYIQSLRYDVDGSPVATLGRLVRVAARNGRACLVMELPVVPTDDDLAYFGRLLDKHRMNKRFVWYTANLRTASRLDAALRSAVWHKSYEERTPEELVAAGVDGVMPRQSHLTLDYVIAMRAAGLRIVPMLANRIEDWERVRDLGLDGVFTDRPTAARKWFRLEYTS